MTQPLHRLMAQASISMYIAMAGWSYGSKAGRPTLHPTPLNCFVRGQDTDGNWGPFSAIFIIIENQPCNESSECDDGLFCNGAENCIDNICHPGTNLCPGQLTRTMIVTLSVEMESVMKHMERIAVTAHKTVQVTVAKESVMTMEYVIISKIEEALALQIADKKS